MSLLAPFQARASPLSLSAARHLASLHLSSPDASAALYDPSGARIQATPNFEEFFGINGPVMPDRHRPPNWRELWTQERSRFIHTTALTGQPMQVVEIAAGFRVESLFASVQDEHASEQIVLQTARRIIRCPALPGTVNSRADDACSYAIEGTWGPLDLLSRRQIEVLRLVTKGMGNDEIGTAIHRTKRAVEWHIRGLFAKLRLTDRVQLHLVGMRAGLADIPDAVWRDVLGRRYS
ncbi:MAG: helix-turn-helix transcriptional regulator [Phycisphaerales bacterium]|nr:helix-turn-helix transcriptional regulator [Phycisphaerales bacterium]